MRRMIGLVVPLLLVVAASLSGRAAEVPFYAGKTITLILSTGASGAYPAYGRTLARHLGDHIAGKPDIVVQYMPGAGGLVASNHLYRLAPRDGTTIGMIHASAMLAPLFGIAQARYDALEFNWLGSIASTDGMCVAWHTSPVKTWNDMLHQPFIVGSTGAGSDMSVYPTLLNKLFGTKIKIVTGYTEVANISIAIERGELEGRCSPQLLAIKFATPDWLTDHKIVVPIVIAESRYEEFPDSPSIMEFVKDDFTRNQLSILFFLQKIDRPVLMPPAVPVARVEELRAAFAQTMRDPAFGADLTKQNLPLDPVYGVDLADRLARAYALPAPVIAAVREIFSKK